MKLRYYKLKTVINCFVMAFSEFEQVKESEREKKVKLNQSTTNQNQSVSGNEINKIYY